MDKDNIKKKLLSNVVSWIIWPLKARVCKAFIPSSWTSNAKQAEHDESHLVNETLLVHSFTTLSLQLLLNLKFSRHKIFN